MNWIVNHVLRSQVVSLDIAGPQHVRGVAVHLGGSVTHLKIGADVVSYPLKGVTGTEPSGKLAKSWDTWMSKPTKSGLAFVGVVGGAVVGG
jgi:hypothetical protein